MRKLDPDYWVKKLDAEYKREQLKQLFERGRDLYRFIITDLRYLNEAEWVVKNGGIVIRVERYGVKPVNDEELRSIRQIDQSGIKTYKVVNDLDAPERAVQRLRHIIQQVEGGR
jgi:hypothetical protein